MTGLNGDIPFRGEWRNSLHAFTNQKPPAGIWLNMTTILSKRSAAPTGRRREFLAAMGLGGLYYTTRGAFAQALVQTPAQTLGPTIRTGFRWIRITICFSSMIR
jgi:hypothetical protein